MKHIISILIVAMAAWLGCSIQAATERTGQVQQAAGLGEYCNLLIPVYCDGALECCNNLCRDTTSDHDYCGEVGCGVNCGRGNICSDSHCCPVGEHWEETMCCEDGDHETNGECCPTGETWCEGYGYGPECVDLQNGDFRCGTCDHECTGVDWCCDGTCELYCCDDADCGSGEYCVESPPNYPYQYCCDDVTDVYCYYYDHCYFYGGPSCNCDYNPGGQGTILCNEELCAGGDCGPALYIGCKDHSSECYGM